MRAHDTQPPRMSIARDYCSQCSVFICILLLYTRPSSCNTPNYPHHPHEVARMGVKSY